MTQIFSSRKQPAALPAPQLRCRAAVQAPAAAKLNTYSLGQSQSSTADLACMAQR